MDANAIQKKPTASETRRVKALSFPNMEGDLPSPASILSQFSSSTTSYNEGDLDIIQEDAVPLITETPLTIPSTNIFLEKPNLDKLNAGSPSPKETFFRKTDRKSKLGKIIPGFGRGSKNA